MFSGGSCRVFVRFEPSLASGLLRSCEKEKTKMDDEETVATQRRASPGGLGRWFRWCKTVITTMIQPASFGQVIGCKSHGPLSPAFSPCYDPSPPASTGERVLRTQGGGRQGFL